MMAMHSSIVILLLLIVAAGRHAAAACVPQEREALLTFKQGIIRDPAGRLASWQQDGEGDCCRWRGVRCSNRTGHVVSLHLRNLQGDNNVLDPAHTSSLTGQISQSLVSLHHLEHLDLSNNNLWSTMGRVPRFLGLLKNLRYLDLSGMWFTGRVPPQLGNLSSLRYLDLSPASWSRTFYSTDISWLSNLPLNYLNMDTVDLDRVVGWPHVVNMIPSLKVLRLSGCDLQSAHHYLPHLNLTNLEELSLSENRFKHPLASCWFWNLTSLQYLGLGSTLLYGQMPDALGGMTSLRVLDFSWARDIVMTDIKKLCNLETLDLSHGNMSSNIIELLPQCSHVKLKELHLGYNNFAGVVPDRIGHIWPNLLILDLFGNHFTGHVPCEISMLHDLNTLDFSGNQFTGPMPSGILKLRNLCVLDLSDNQLTGHVPSEIGMLGNLNYMDLSNNDLSGVITHEHLAGLRRLRTINLSDNSLKIKLDPEWLPPFRLQHAYFGCCQMMDHQFPTWLQSQTDIFELDISGASISDRLPDWFFTTFSNARTLDISNNRISGTLPASLENMTSLEELYLNSNQLTGQVPLLPNRISLLDISMNYLFGPLPSNFVAPHLEELSLFSNHITGRIPQSICELNVYALNIGKNHLEGELPQCFGPNAVSILILSNNMLSGKLEPILKAYPYLWILDLAWNSFTGSIPATITELEGLFHLNLAGNSLSGSLPHHLSNLTRMNGTHDQYSDDFKVNMSITMKGQERYYYSTEVYNMVSIDLSSNNLTGGIPEGITSLYGVVNLNLSRNCLTGKISETIGAMYSLESLDLSRNELYGPIPPTLSNLTFLSVLDLSHNNLTGKIPSGGQLDSISTQNPHIYDGNIGLCGYPVRKNCTGNIEPKHGDQKVDENDSKILTFSFALGMGYVVGLSMVFCVILFKGSWRLAYFKLFDKAFDEVYVFLVVTWARWAKKTPNH